MLCKVTNETIMDLFGDYGGKYIVDSLEGNSDLKLEEIVEQPKALSENLRKLLGSGAFVVEKLILKNLHCKLRLKFEEKKGYKFSEYIEDLTLECGLKRDLSQGSAHRDMKRSKK